MELWELNAILDTELSKPEDLRDYPLIEDLAAILGVDIEREGLDNGRVL